MPHSPVMTGEKLRSTPILSGLPLTRTERRIIALTAGGRSLRQIAFEVGLTMSAVKRQRWRLQEKLGATNAANAVAIWLGREALDRLVAEALLHEDG